MLLHYIQMTTMCIFNPRILNQLFSFCIILIFSSCVDAFENEANEPTKGVNEPTKELISWVEPEIALKTNWDWTTSESIELYHMSKNSNKVMKMHNTYTPFFTNGCSLANYKDMNPEDGWTLVYRNFGSTDTLPIGGIPSFALYNKYTNILRVMTHILKSSEPELTHVQGVLKKETEANPLFTYDTYDYTKLDGDSSLELSQTAMVHLSNRWLYNDFVIDGYDPNQEGDKLYYSYSIKGINVIYIGYVRDLEDKNYHLYTISGVF